MTLQNIYKLSHLNSCFDKDVTIRQEHIKGVYIINTCHNIEHFWLSHIFIKILWRISAFLGIQKFRLLGYLWRNWYWCIINQYSWGRNVQLCIKGRYYQIFLNSWLFFNNFHIFYLFIQTISTLSKLSNFSDFWHDSRPMVDEKCSDPDFLFLTWLPRFWSFCSIFGKNWPERAKIWAIEAKIKNLATSVFCITLAYYHAKKSKNLLNFE